jgi:hypothetical protein
MEVIKRVSEYHYITALPSSIDYTDPIYANKHAEAFKICRGRGGVSSIDGSADARSLRLTANLASYEKCVAELSAKDILDLRSTDEGRAYYKAKYDFDVGKFEESKRNFYVALSGYVRRIDDRIIQRFGAHHKGDERFSLEFELKTKSKRVNKVIDWSPDILVYVTIALDQVGTVISPLWSLLCVLPAINRAKKIVRAALDNPYVDPGLPEEVVEQNLRELKMDELRERGGSHLPAEVKMSKSSENAIADETIYTGEVTS